MDCRRLVADADEERKGFERELHDGVQQDLIALSVRLQLARRLAGAELAEELEEMGREVHEALDHVRVLANRIYPSLLATLGLADALRADGVVVEEGGTGRDDPVAESAVVFLCRDLGASHVRLGRADGTLTVELDFEARDEARIRAALARLEAIGADVAGLREGHVCVSVPDAGRSAR